jgi:hypothetical protein
MKKETIPTAILGIEFIVAVVFVVLSSRNEASITTDDVAYALRIGAFWAVIAFLSSLALFITPRRLLWVDAVVVAIAFGMSVWGQLPDPGPNFGKGFAWTLVPGVLIGAAISLLYKGGALVASRGSAER